MDTGSVPDDFGENRSAGGVTGTPGEVLGLSGPEGRERTAAQEVARHLPRGVRIGLGEGGVAPLSLSLSLSFLPPSLFLVGLGKGSPTPTRRRTPPPWRAPRAGRPPPLLLYIRGQGGTSRHTTDIRYFSRVRCPPPPYYTSIIPLRSLGEALRR